MQINRLMLLRSGFIPRLGIILVFLFHAPALLAAEQEETVSFVVSMEQPATHTYHVDMSYKGAMGEIVDLKMPMWTPGYYGILDFPKNVRNFHVADGRGTKLAWEKTTENCWRICSNHSSQIRVSYDVLATTPFVANCYLDENRGYIMPAGIFFHIAGRIRQPVTVTIEPYDSWTDIATGLKGVPGKKDTFSAPDFDIFYDSPILIGNLERLPSFTVRGIVHDFVGYRLGNFDRQQFIGNLKAVIEAGINIIGEIPYRHYTFIAIGPGQGGIEHLNSTSFSFDGDGLDSREAMIGSLGFLAHEYFHHYNVKRIRPLALGPFDYDKPNLTNMLWVSEGFTVYYQNLMLARAGLITRDELLESFGRNIAAYEKGTGRYFQSATQSSFETWTQGPFGGRGEGIVKTISYYNKGALLGLLLDLKIRHETQNKRSLDDVMRTLYRETYKEKQRGFTDQEFQDVCERVARAPLADIFRYATTMVEVDYAKYLGYAGLELEPPIKLPSPYFGAIVEDQGENLIVAAVENNSPARQANLEAQSIIRQLNGHKVNAKEWNEEIASRKPGDTVRLTITSGGTDREVTIRLGNKMDQSYKMKAFENPTPLQSRILQGLMQQE
jgi:predicted metalloprotease with PDZ domain